MVLQVVLVVCVPVCGTGSELPGLGHGTRAGDTLAATAYRGQRGGQLWTVPAEESEGGRGGVTCTTGTRFSLTTTSMHSQDRDTGTGSDRH